MVALAKTEAALLAECEDVIERGLESFIEVGNALLRIREGNLYRAQFDNFPLYCQLRWGMNKSHAYRMIDAAEVAKNLGSELVPKLGTLNPATPKEGTLRPLVALPAPKQREAWAAAVETAKRPGKPTAKEVAAAVEVVAPKPKVERVSYIPSNGLQYADMAIASLEKIQPNDTQRKRAFQKVKTWIAQRESNQ